MKLEKLTLSKSVLVIDMATPSTDVAILLSLLRHSNNSSRKLWFSFSNSAIRVSFGFWELSSLFSSSMTYVACLSRKACWESRLRIFLELLIQHVRYTKYIFSLRPIQELESTVSILPSASDVRRE